MIHNDMVGWPTDPFQEFMAEWNGHHNNEPFERGSATLDFDWRPSLRCGGLCARRMCSCEPVGCGLYGGATGVSSGFRGALKR